MTKLDLEWAEGVVEHATKETVQNTLSQAIEELKVARSKSKKSKNTHVECGWMILNEGFTKARFTKTYPALQGQRVNVYDSKKQAKRFIKNDATERVVRVRIEVTDEN